MYDRNNRTSIDVGNFEPLEDRSQPAIQKVVNDKDLSNLVDQYKLERETAKRSTSRKQIIRDRIMRILRQKAARLEDGTLFLKEFPNVRAVPNKSVDINQDALRSVLLSRNELKDAELVVEVLFKAKYNEAIKLLRKLNEAIGEAHPEIATAIQYPLANLTKEERNDISVETEIGDGYKICIGEEVEE